MTVATAGRVILPMGASPPVLAPTSFQAAAQASVQDPVVLVSVTLAAKGSNPARTIRLSDREFTDADGNHWNALILDKSSIDAGGAWLESSWQPIDFELTVGDGKMDFQPLGQTFEKLLSQYDWVGAGVQVIAAFTNLTATSDYQIIFDGEIAAIEEVTPTDATLRCVQKRGWIVPVPTSVIERNTYPGATDDVVGRHLQLIIGDWLTNRGKIAVGTNYYSFYAGIARAAVPLQVIDAGRSTGIPRYFVSEKGLDSSIESMAMIEDSAFGRMAGIRQGLVFDSNGAANGPHYFDMPSDPNDRRFQLAILPVTISNLTNGTQWIEAIREDKDINLTGFASLDWDAGKKVLRYKMPDVPELGKWQSTALYVWFNKTSSSAPHPRYGIDHPVNGTSYTDFNSGVFGTIGNASPSGDDNNGITSTVLTKWTDIGEADLIVEVRAAGQKLTLHRVALVVTYVPNANVLLQGRPGYRALKQVGIARFKTPQLVEVSRTPDELSYDAPSFTFQKGAPDDGSGTYTGTASAVIEHPCDFVRWMLRTYCGISTSEIISAGSSFGSFVDARSALSNYKMLAFYQGESAEDIIQEVANEFLIWFFRKQNATNSPWVAIPWSIGDAVNYRSASNVFTFGMRYIVNGSLKARMSPISKVFNVVRVNYDWDPRSNAYAHQAFISDTDSRGWTGSSEARDESAGREPLAAASVTLNGRREFVHNMKYCRDPYTATQVRNRLFDHLYRPRVELSFSTFVNAYDMERGMVFPMDSELDAVMPYPLAGSDGSWYGKKFRAVRVTRREAGATTYSIEAVEV